MSTEFCQGGRRVSISLLYCCATMATIWFYVAMTLISLCIEGTTVLSTFFVLLLCFLWSLTTASSGTICMFVLPLTKAKQSRFENFIRSLIDCNAEFGKLRTASRKMLIVAVAVWVTATLSAINTFVYVPWASVGNYKPWNVWSYRFSMVSSVSLILGYGAWLFPVSLFCITCLVLEQLFDDFCKRASKKHLNSLNLTVLKDEHRKLCGVVELASKMFSPLLLIMFSLYIPLLCFNFYITVNRPLSQMSDEVSTETAVFDCIYWIMVSSGTMAVFLVFGTRVNEKASYSNQMNLSLLQTGKEPVFSSIFLHLLTWPPF